MATLHLPVKQPTKQQLPASAMPKQPALTTEQVRRELGLDMVQDARRRTLDHDVSR